MSTLNSLGTFSPMIPRHLITGSDIILFTALNILMESACEDGHGNELVYLCHEESCHCGTIGDEFGGKEVNTEDLYKALQDIIKRSDGLLTYITHEQAHTCSKIEPSSQGGTAVFITADDIKYQGTSDWLSEQINALSTTKNGNDPRGELHEIIKELVKAGKLVCERWQHGDLAEAVRNLDTVIDYSEYSISKIASESETALLPEHKLHEAILDLYNSADNCGCEHPFTVCNEEYLLAVYLESKRLKDR